jgi:hypothetical protein
MTRAAVAREESALLGAGLMVRSCEQLQIPQMSLAGRDFGDGLEMFVLIGEVGRALAPEWIRLAHLPRQARLLDRVSHKAVEAAVGVRRGILRLKAPGAETDIATGRGTVRSLR